MEGDFCDGYEDIDDDEDDDDLCDGVYFGICDGVGEDFGEVEENVVVFVEDFDVGVDFEVFLDGSIERVEGGF